jgi:hypothetical protein
MVNSWRYSVLAWVGRKVNMGRLKHMGRKKSDPVGMPPRPTAVTIKATPEWKSWVEGVAAHCRDTVSALFDKAVAEYAKAHGYDVPPPPR